MHACRSRASGRMASRRARPRPTWPSWSTPLRAACARCSTARRDGCGSWCAPCVLVQHSAQGGPHACQQPSPGWLGPKLPLRQAHAFGRQAHARRRVHQPQGCIATSNTHAWVRIPSTDGIVAVIHAHVCACVRVQDMQGYSRANSPPLSVSLKTLHILADHYPVRPGPLRRCMTALHCHCAALPLGTSEDGVP